MSCVSHIEIKLNIFLRTSKSDIDEFKDIDTAKEAVYYSFNGMLLVIPNQVIRQVVVQIKNGLQT